MEPFHQNAPPPGDRRVGIRELRHGFRSYVDRVRRGERFVITDRGEPVGEFVPLRRGPSRLDQMFAEGRALPATAPLRRGYDPADPITTDVGDELARMREDDRES